MIEKIKKNINKSFEDVLLYPHILTLTKHSLKIMIIMAIATSCSVILFGIIAGLNKMCLIGQIILISLFLFLTYLYRRNLNPLKLVVSYLIIYFILVSSVSVVLSFLHPMVPVLITFMFIMIILLLDEYLRMLIISFYCISISGLITLDIIKLYNDSLYMVKNYWGRLVGVAITIIMLCICVWGFKKKFVELNQTMYTHSIRDSLTGAYNIRKLKEEMKKNIEKFNVVKQNFSIILIDLDNFKLINDTLGHDTGDILLKEFSLLVDKHIRDRDFLVRYGGDEFVLLLPNCDAKTSNKVCQRILDETQALISSGSKLMVSFSAGICDYIEAHASKKDILKIADKRMYLSKSRGRNRITLCDNISQKTEELIII